MHCAESSPEGIKGYSVRGVQGRDEGRKCARGLERPGLRVSLAERSAHRGAHFNRALYRVRRVGAELGVRPLRLHDARHTFASLALSAGKPLPWVSKTIGHRRVSTTADIYSHVLPTDAVDLGFLPGIPTAGDRRGSFSRNKSSRLATAGDTVQPNSSVSIAREGLESKK